MDKKKKKLSGAETSERRLPPDPRPAPWLVYTHGQGMTNQTFFNLCDEPITENENPITQKPITVNPTNGKTYPKCIPEISGKSFWQSPTHDGWLIILCDDTENKGQYSNSKWKLGDCFLWNPVSLETIELPSLSQQMDTQLRPLFAFLSCPPTNPDDDPMVFLIYAGIQAGHLFLCCRPRVDKEWRVGEFGLHVPDGIDTFFCFKGVLHLTRPNLFGIYVPCFEIVKCPVNDKEVVKVKYLRENHEPLLSVGSFTHHHDNFVESGDEIYKVARIHHPSPFDREIYAVEIFRKDFSMRTWVKVESLGNHVLFISNHSTASCLAEEMGLTRGCVYFTQPNDMSLYTFDLEGDSISVVVPCPDLPMPSSSPDWVMMPTVTSVADARRAEDILHNEEESIIIEASENNCSIDVEEKEEDSQKSNVTELEDSGGWGILCEDTLLSIACLLQTVDRIHFRAVCQGYRSVIPAVGWRTASTDIIRTTSLSPWLVYAEKPDPTFIFVNPMHDNEMYRMNLPEYMLDAKIRFSKDGWLLMSRGKQTVFFFNPFTREMIPLPEFPRHVEYLFYGISFSSLPTSADCVVFAIAEWGNDKVFVIYISRGNDSWSFNIFDNTRLPSSENCLEFVPCFNCPVFHNGAFYCLGYEGILGKFDLEDNFSWKVLANPQRPWISFAQNYLVEFEGKLLSVLFGHLGSRVRIYTLDSSKMAWVKVKTLGKQMLCVSRTSCFSAVAPKSCMENKIYFSRFHGEEILFYSLDTGRYHTLGSRHSALDFHNTKMQFNCSWIEPNWSRNTDQKLDWSKKI